MRDINPTITIAQITRTTLTNKLNNSSIANTNIPTKIANGTGGVMTSSAAIMRGGNATVLPPEPVFTTKGGKTRSEAGRGDGDGGVGAGGGVGGLGGCGFVVRRGVRDGKGDCWGLV